MRLFIVTEKSLDELKDMQPQYWSNLVIQARNECDAIRRCLERRKFQLYSQAPTHYDLNVYEVMLFNTKVKATGTRSELWDTYHRVAVT